MRIGVAWLLMEVFPQILHGFDLKCTLCLIATQL